MSEPPSKIHVVWARAKGGGPWEALLVELVPPGFLLMHVDREYKHVAYDAVPVLEAQAYRDADGAPTETSVRVVSEGSMGKAPGPDQDCG